MNEEETAIIGVYRYRGLAAVSHYRLTLNLNGSMEVHSWRDLGGSWDLECRGRYSVAGDKVTLVPEWPPRARHITYPENLSKPFHARLLNEDLVLISDENIVEFDQSAGMGSTELRQTHSFREGWSGFWKNELPKALVCIVNEPYEHALTIGKTYVAMNERVDVGLAQVRLAGDHGRNCWFPSSHFRDPRPNLIPLVPEL